MRPSILYFLLVFTGASCTNTTPDFTDSNLVTPGCRLSFMQKGVTNKLTFSYNDQGQITQMVRDEPNSQGVVQQYIFTFTYDNNGRLVGSAWTLNGKADGSAQYEYDNGRIARTKTTFTDGKTAVGNIRYYVNGRISEYTFDSGRDNSSGRRYFENDANGVLTKAGFSDLKGVKYFEVNNKPVGSVKMPTQLLISHGLPFDILTGYPWEEVVGGVGSTSEVSYSSSQTGLLVPAYNLSTTNLQTDSRGFITEISAVDQSGKVITDKYTITNCQ